MSSNSNNAEVIQIALKYSDRVNLKVNYQLFCGSQCIANRTENVKTNPRQPVLFLETCGNGDKMQRERCKDTATSRCAGHSDPAAVNSQQHKPVIYTQINKRIRVSTNPTKQISRFPGHIARKFQ